MTIACTRLICAAVLATAPWAASAASTSVAAQLDRPSGIFGGSINTSILDPVGPVEFDIADPYGYASTYAVASFGTLKSRAVAGATAEAFGRFFARSVARFDDTFSIVAAGMDGLAGTVTVDLVFDRAMSFEGNAVDSYATAALTFGTNFHAYTYNETLWLQPGGCVPGYSDTCALEKTTSSASHGIAVAWLSERELRAEIPFTFGEATDFYVNIDLTALASYYGGASEWISDASHSFYWAGIAGVTDAAGTSLAFDVTSASGTDYRVSQAPIPEPSTLLLAGAGLLALVFARHRRAAGAATPSAA